MILDTNTYSALASGKQQILNVIQGMEEIKLPLPVIAELRYGFMNGGQLQRNEQNLERFMAQPQVSVIVPNLETTHYYAQIQLFCKQHGKALSHNDIWIASLALQLNELLITYDVDFSVLQDLFGQKLIILTNT